MNSHCAMSSAECQMGGKFGHQNRQLGPFLHLASLAYVTSGVPGMKRLPRLAGRTVALTWGRGEDGALGHGDQEDRPTPTIVKGLENVGTLSAIVCGAEFTMAISDKEVYSWGWCALPPNTHPLRKDLSV